MKKLIFFLIIVLLLAGCQKAPAKRGGPNKLEGQTRYLYLKLSAKVDKSSFSPGEDIEVKVSLTNTGQKDFKFTFPNGKSFDLAAENQQGKEVFRDSNGKYYIQAERPVTLKPNQKISEQFNFSLDKKGSYKIKGETAKLYFNERKSTTLVTSPIDILL